MITAEQWTTLVGLADFMKERALTSVTIGGVTLAMDPRGFAIPAPTQTLVIPSHEVPPEAQELFRELTDDELLTYSGAPAPPSEKGDA